MITTNLYTIDMIREDVRKWVEQGFAHRHQPIYTLSRLVPAREWQSFEREIELNEYLLRDRVSDLIPQERWQND